MESSQAVNCVKAFGHINRAITFERTNELAGYVIRINDLKYESDREIVRNVARQLCLTVQEDAESIAIL